MKSIFGGRIYFSSSKNNVLDRLKIQFVEIWLQSFKRTKNRLLFHQLWLNLDSLGYFRLS